MFALRILSSILPLIAIAVMAEPGLAGPKVDLSCVHRPDSQENCTPLVACFGTSGLYFTGRAIGWNDGTFAGDTNAGFACIGQWMARNALGLGQAVFECDNGRHGVVYFTYRDNQTGTATGGGFLDDARAVRMWSGHNIHQFIINDSGDINARLMCGDTEVPIS